MTRDESPSPTSAQGTSRERSRKVLMVLVDSDPRLSPRPAEAVRIAAGLEAGDRFEVRLCLFGPAVLVAGESPVELCDGEIFSVHLASLSRDDRPIYVEKGTNFLAQIRPDGLNLREISNGELAMLLAEGDCLLRF